MIEMARLEESKEIENKVRWDAQVDGIAFRLYIPKWRVPEPCPRLIDVTISPYAQRRRDKLSQDVACKSPGSRVQRIVTHLKKFREHTQTVRYQPEGDPSEWEIGEPYIPTLKTFGSSRTPDNYREMAAFPADISESADGSGTWDEKRRCATDALARTWPKT